MSIAAPAPSLAETFALILQALRRATAARMARHPLDIPVLMLLWVRLGRAIARFTALTERAAAGRPSPLRPGPRRDTPRHPAPLRLPRGFGWLCRKLPCEAACFGSQLQHLLSQPAAKALLDTAPQAGRILRPLLHMMAVPCPAILARPAKAQADTPIPREPAPLPRSAVPPPDPTPPNATPPWPAWQPRKTAVRRPGARGVRFALP